MIRREGGSIMSFLIGYKVTVAQKDDIEGVLSLLKDVAHHLKEKGSKQWETLLNGEEDHELIKAIEQEQTYIVKKENATIATFTIYPHASDWDKMLWKGDGEAVYLHKLAISPNEAGKGLGQQILSWLENDLRKKEIYKLRLDCIGDNEKLNRFYDNAGFQKIGNSHGFSLYEKNLKQSLSQKR